MKTVSNEPKISNFPFKTCFRFWQGPVLTGFTVLAKDSLNSVVHATTTHWQREWDSTSFHKDLVSSFLCGFLMSTIGQLEPFDVSQPDSWGNYVTSSLPFLASKLSHNC